VSENRLAVCRSDEVRELPVVQYILFVVDLIFCFDDNLTTDNFNNKVKQQQTTKSTHNQQAKTPQNRQITNSQKNNK
jgi:hypothetical protein